MAASVARFFTERDERNRRAEAVRPDNKTALFDALAAAGITLVTVTFDGSGDSGQIEDITAQSDDRTVDLPQGEITIATVAWGTDKVTAISMGVEAAIEQLAYDFLSETHGGWENNDGAYGEFSFDVAARTITLDYNERYTATEFYSHEF
ncbi:hypothetical protein CDV52_11755 [Haematobacter missouriensis]|nr:hypothetical protein CDV53_06385 [Haematobacter missouriensis]OWJ83309.1 hypothetical protein CDV52_11755 [Haematobacter missouriensis]